MKSNEWKTCEQYKTETLHNTFNQNLKLPPLNSINNNNEITMQTWNDYQT